jgi:hypothetical protein
MDGREKRRLENAGSRSGDNEPLPTFACHFRKKDPTKYSPLTRKYHNCISPRIPHHRLRAIK